MSKIPKVLSAADVLVSSSAEEALEVSLNFMIPSNENQVEANLLEKRRFQCSEI